MTEPNPHMEKSERDRFLRELARIYHTSVLASLVLDKTFPDYGRERRPNMDATRPIAGWNQILRDFDDGAVEEPYPRLLAVVLDEHPGNPVFGELAEKYCTIPTQPSVDEPASPGPASLPGVDESESKVGSPEGVRDWDLNRLSRRLGRLLRPAALGLSAAGASASAAVLVPGRWRWVVPATIMIIVGLVIVLTIARRRHRADRSLRQRQIILKSVRAHAADLLAWYRDGIAIPPRFVRVQPVRGKKKKGRSRIALNGTPGDGGSYPYPEGTTVLELFEDAAETLVLLSEPGMGKTTQLALLADELVRRALATPRGEVAVLPILVNLSTYRGQPFEEWLAAEVGTVYPNIHPAFVRGLLAQTVPGKASADEQADDVLLLLDGLDEIPERQHREACAEHLRQFQRRCVGLVVTCRSRDVNLAARIKAVRHVMIKEPDKAAVQRYLTTNDETLADVRAALESDLSLWELLQSPLMLQIISRTYAHRPAAELRSPGTTEKERQERQKRIFDAYIRHALDYHTNRNPTERINRTNRYTHGRTLNWLTWLARTLSARGERVLYLDRLDLDWIPPENRIVPRGLSGYVIQFLGMTLTLAWLVTAVACGVIDTSLRDAAVLTLVTLVTTASQVIIYEKMNDERSPSQGLIAPIKANAPTIIIGGFLVSYIDWSAPGIVLVVLTWVWVHATTIEGTFRPVFTPVEQLRWSWTPKEKILYSPEKTILARSAVTIALGTAKILLFGYAFYIFCPQPPWVSPAATLLLLAVYLLGNNFEPSLQDNRPRPNEGIRRSLRFALTHGFVNTLVVALSLIVLISLATPHSDTLRAWLVAGLLASFYGLVRGFRYGGLALVQHWAIRAVLIRNGSTPLRYQRFLHDAEQRILLRRVGSGFSFPHRLLQEHLNTDPGELLSRLAPTVPVQGDVGLRGGVEATRHASEPWGSVTSPI